MVWKIIFLAFLAVGALAQYEFNEDKKLMVKTTVTAMCKKSGAEDKAGEVENAVTEFADSIKSLVDPETIKKEIEDAKPIGALDEVFKKYCNKAPQLKNSIHTLSSKVAVCLEPSIKEHIPAANNATDQLIDFICFKDGDRIALFIAEGGPECFMEKSNGIRECASKLKGEVTNVEEAKKLSLTEQCAKFQQLSTCVVAELEKCSTPTPGNMAEALFKFIRNGSPCAPKSA